VNRGDSQYYLSTSVHSARKLTSVHLCSGQALLLSMTLPPYKRRGVASNVRSDKSLGAYHDFPIYVPRPLALRQEMKFLDQFFDLSAVPGNISPGTITFDSTFTYPTAGDGLSFRLSDRILLDKLQVRGGITAGTTVPLGSIMSTHLELFIIWEKFPRGTSPLPFGDVLSPDTGTTVSVGYLINPDARDRFEILYHCRWILNPARVSTSSTALNGASATLPDTAIVDFDLPLDRIVSFKDSGGTLSSVVSGYLRFILIQDTASLGSTDLASYICQYRLQFADL